VQLWRKICTETTIEISLVAENRKLLLAGIVFQVPSFLITVDYYVNLFFFSNLMLNRFLCDDVNEYFYLFILQYIHGLAAHGIHYLHRPGPTLQDAGFFLLPVRNISFRNTLLFVKWNSILCSFSVLFQELGQDRAYVSETSFTFIFASFVLVRFFFMLLLVDFLFYFTYSGIFSCNLTDGFQTFLPL
jgi:hypothetical protein